MSVINLDCVAGMRLLLADNSVDAIVCDPPYELTGARPGGRSEATRGAVMGGFMGLKWDGTGIAFSVEMWREAFRVLKPGGHLLAFSGSRTYHRMACAIEDAGFDIRDQIMWVYSSGFPKSHNLDNHRGKIICGCATGTLPYTHENTEPKPQYDVPCVHDAHVSPPVANGGRSGALLQPSVPQQSTPAHGAASAVGSAARTAQSRVEGRRDHVQAQGELQGHSVHSSAGMAAPDGAQGRLHHGAPGCDGGMVRLPADANGGCAPHRPRSDEQPAWQSGTMADEQRAQAMGAWSVCPGCGLPMVPEGWGTALKPAHEPICVARKPLIGTVAANVLAHGTGALNIDGCRVDGEPWKAHSATGLGSVKFFSEGDNAVIDKVPHDAGRWPANLIHDGSDEVLAAFPDASGQQGAITGNEPSGVLGHANTYGKMDRRKASTPRREEDRNAARFFYCAKASKADRGNGNTHPTVKPAALMQYLVRLVTPPGGLVLDPFTGSGSTWCAAKREGFQFIGFELDPAYCEIATRRAGAA